MPATAPEETRLLRLPFRWQVEVEETGELGRLAVKPDEVSAPTLRKPHAGPVAQRSQVSDGASVHQSVA